MLRCSRRGCLGQNSEQGGHEAAVDGRAMQTRVVLISSSEVILRLFFI